MTNFKDILKKINNYNVVYASTIRNNIFPEGEKKMQISLLSCA